MDTGCCGCCGCCCCCCCCCCCRISIFQLYTVIKSRSLAQVPEIVRTFGARVQLTKIQQQQPPPPTEKIHLECISHQGNYPFYLLVVHQVGPKSAVLRGLALQQAAARPHRSYGYHQQLCQSSWMAESLAILGKFLDLY